MSSPVVVGEGACREPVGRVSFTSSVGTGAAHVRSKVERTVKVVIANMADQQQRCRFESEMKKSGQAAKVKVK